MDIFKKIFNDWEPLSILAKSPTLDIKLGSEYASETPIPLIHRTKIQIIILKK